MGKRAIRIEFEDDEGGKYLFKLEGNITRDKILKLIDIYELMNLKNERERNVKNLENPELSLQEKILLLIEDEFTFKEFNSRELQEAFEDKYNEPIKLSIISTYLRRFSDNGILERRKGRKKSWRYSLKVRNTPILRKRR